VQLQQSLVVAFLQRQSRLVCLQCGEYASLKVNKSIASKALPHWSFSGFCIPWSSTRPPRVFCQSRIGRSVYALLYWLIIKPKTDLILHEFAGLLSLHLRLLLEEVGNVVQGHVLAVKVVALKQKATMFSTWISKNKIIIQFYLRLFNIRLPCHAGVDVAGVELDVDLLIDSSLRIGCVVLPDCRVGRCHYYSDYSFYGKWTNEVVKKEPLNRISNNSSKIFHW
jgi:hypothetical protein